MKQEKKDDIFSQVADLEEVPENFHFDKEKVWDELEERLSINVVKAKNRGKEFIMVAAVLIPLIIITLYFSLIKNNRENQIASIKEKNDLLMSDSRKIGEINQQKNFYLNKASSNEKNRGEEYPEISIRGVDWDPYVRFCREKAPVLRSWYNTIDSNPYEKEEYDKLIEEYDKLIEKYDKLIELYNKDLAFNKELLNENRTDLATSFNNIGILYSQNKLIDSSIIKYHEHALVIYKELYKKECTKLANIYNNIRTIKVKLEFTNQQLDSSNVPDALSNRKGRTGYLLNINLNNSANVLNVEANELGHVGFLENINVANIDNSNASTPIIFHYTLFNKGEIPIGNTQSDWIDAIYVSKENNRNESAIEGSTIEIGYSNLFKTQAASYISFLETGNFNLNRELELYYDKFKKNVQDLSLDGIINLKRIRFHHANVTQRTLVTGVDSSLIIKK